LEYIQTVSIDIKSKIVDQSLTNQYVLTAVESIESSVKNAQNITSFMTMSINRCIDYTKATNGLKLNARFETVFLNECIDLPLNCMKDLQSASGIQIEFDEKSISSICSHIITDKQWLQENLLCLLSNAVKYSKRNAGNVKISVQLIKKGVKNPIFLDTNFLDSSLQSLARQTSFLVNRSKPTSTVDLLTQSNNRTNNLLNLKNFSPVKDILENTKKFKNSSLSGDDNGESESLIKNSAVFQLANKNIKDTDTSGNLLVDFLRFEVIDCGIGLPEETMNALFKPFTQSQRLAGGTGLGLFSLARRVEALQGYYGVEKRPDGLKGSLFWFEIPYKPDVQAESLYGLRCFDERSRSNSFSSSDYAFNIESSDNDGFNLSK
jgi:signal transduction histidine kinase